jgi:hypothetical protein
MKIEVSQHNYTRLQRHGRTFEDSPDSVVGRLLDYYEERNGPRLEASQVPISPHGVTDLRGFQKELWELVIMPMPNPTFSLTDVYAREKVLEEKRPHVKELRASIRAGLENLRDKGYLQFVDNRGRYRRLR